MSNLLFQFIKNIEYIAQPIAAPTIHKSPEVNLTFINKAMSPLQIIIRTPNRDITKPKNLEKLIFSLKNIIDSNIINIGEDV